MRILFATAHKHLPEIRGGMEINTHALCLAVREHGVEAAVLCGLAGVGFTGLSARIRRKALGNQCPMDKRLGYPVWRSYSPWAQVAAVVERFRPDAIIVQGGADFTPIVVSCLQTGLPLFGYLHTQDRLLLEGPLEPAAERMLFFANSAYMKSFHTDKRFAGILLPLMQSKTYRTETARTHAVFVNPVPKKGVHIALALAERRPDVPFLFVRNPHSRTADPEAPTGPLPSNVSILGPISDMRAIYRKAKVILAPSQWVETFGRVITEAQFSGIPALASTRGGLPEAVGSGGICVPADAAVEEWLSAFSTIWDDLACYRQLSEHAKVHSQRPELQPDVIVAALLDGLRSSVDRRAGRN